MSLWNTLKNGIQILLESHRQHLVGLIKYQITHIVQYGHLLPRHQVYQSTWRCNNDVNPMLQSTNLRFYVCSTIDGKDANLGQVLSKALQVIGNLQAKFTRRTQDNHARMVGPLEEVQRLGIIGVIGVFGIFRILSHQPLQQRQPICRGLSCTRLSQCHEVAFFTA